MNKDSMHLICNLTVAEFRNILLKSKYRITYMFLLYSYSITEKGYMYVLPFIHMQQMQYNK